jgi:hypothetical protein
MNSAADRLLLLQRLRSSHLGGGQAEGGGAGRAQGGGGGGDALQALRGYIGGAAAVVRSMTAASAAASPAAAAAAPAPGTGAAAQQAAQGESQAAALVGSFTRGGGAGGAAGMQQALQQAVAAAGGGNRPVSITIHVPAREAPATGEAAASLRQQQAAPDSDQARAQSWTFVEATLATAQAQGSLQALIEAHHQVQAHGAAMLREVLGDDSQLAALVDVDGSAGAAAAGEASVAGGGRQDVDMADAADVAGELVRAAPQRQPPPPLPAPTPAAHLRQAQQQAPPPQQAPQQQVQVQQQQQQLQQQQAPQAPPRSSRSAALILKALRLAVARNTAAAAGRPAGPAAGAAASPAPTPEAALSAVMASLQRQLAAERAGAEGVAQPCCEEEEEAALLAAGAAAAGASADPAAAAAAAAAGEAAPDEAVAMEVRGVGGGGVSPLTAAPAGARPCAGPQRHAGGRRVPRPPPLGPQVDGCDGGRGERVAALLAALQPWESQACELDALPYHLGEGSRQRLLHTANLHLCHPQ